MAFAPGLKGLLSIQTTGLFDTKYGNKKKHHCFGKTKSGSRCTRAVSAQQIALSALRIQLLALVDLGSAAAYTELCLLSKSYLCYDHKDEAGSRVDSWVREYESRTCTEWQDLQRKNFRLQALSLVGADDAQESGKAADEEDTPNNIISPERESKNPNGGFRSGAKLDASPIKPAEVSAEHTPETPTKPRRSSELSRLSKSREPLKTPYTPSTPSPSAKSEDEDTPTSQASDCWSVRGSDSRLSTPGTSPPSRGPKRSTNRQLASLGSPIARHASNTEALVTPPNTRAAAKKLSFLDYKRKTDIDSRDSKELSSDLSERLDKQVVNATPYKDLIKNAPKFEVYSPRSSTTIYDVLQSPPDKDCKGYIYMLQRTSAPGFIKIGISNNPTRRIHEHQKRCWEDATRIQDDESVLVRFHKQLERLVHKELHPYRRREVCCEGCQVSHREWFEIELDFARAVIKRWREWLLDFPYGGDRKLKECWKQHSETISSSYEQGFDWQCWMDSLPDQSKKRTQPMARLFEVPRPYRARRHSFATWNKRPQQGEEFNTNNYSELGPKLSTRVSRSNSLSRFKPLNDIALRKAFDAFKALARTSPNKGRVRRLSEIKPEDVQGMLAQPVSPDVISIPSDPKASEPEIIEPEEEVTEEDGPRITVLMESDERSAKLYKPTKPRPVLAENRNKQDQNLVLGTKHHKITDISAEQIEDMVSDIRSQPNPSSVDSIKKPLATDESENPTLTKNHPIPGISAERIQNAVQNTPSHPQIPSPNIVQPPLATGGAEGVNQPLKARTKRGVKAAVG